MRLLETEWSERAHKSTRTRWDLMLSRLMFFEAETAGLWIFDRHSPSGSPRVCGSLAVHLLRTATISHTDPADGARYALCRPNHTGSENKEGFP